MHVSQVWKGSMDSLAEIFSAYRRRLFGIAYRMLGSRADAEDILQETYLRWLDSHTSEPRSLEAWLVTVVTRLCIDRLRSAKAEREVYTGLWLPEPLVAPGPLSPERTLEFASDLSIAFLLVLERLAPDERAAFLLHEVFDFDYAGNLTDTRQKPSRLPANSPPRQATRAGRSAAIRSKPRSARPIAGKVPGSCQRRQA